MRSTLLLAAAAAVVRATMEVSLTKIQPGQPGLNRRATYVETLANNITGGGYYADVLVGTPGQRQRLVVDTGSSDIWVVAYNADLCGSTRLQRYYQDSCSTTCEPGDFAGRRAPADSRTVKPADSSSFKVLLPRRFQIQYLDGSGSAGDYITDDFQIGGATVKNLQMGYAVQTVRGVGIMGVGFSSHEAAEDQYPNIMDELTLQGVIQVKAFSLYLNDRRSDAGNLLFGGLDTEKFVGPLSVLPMIRDQQTGTISTYTVAMNGMSAVFPNGSVYDVPMPANNVPALLDSGTTLSYIPERMAVPLFDKLGAYTDTRQTGLTFIDCSFLKVDAGLVITFSFTGGPTISVPVTEMVLDVFSAFVNLPPGIPFNDVCLFGLQSTGSFSSQSQSLASSNFVLLGDSFLRSAYVVYDLDHQEIGLAPANLNSSTSNVVEFKAADSGIPAATGVAAQVAGNGGGSPTSRGGGTVTVTQSGNPNAAGPGARGPGLDVLAVMALAGVFAVFGGAMVVL